MTQPCGKVLGRSENNFRLYSRASPIICIADVVYFLALVGLGFSYNRRVFLRNIKYELRHRFADGVYDDTTNAEKSLVIPWSLVVLGGIPCQTIKLMAMDGLFWQDLGFDVYCFNFFGEIVLVLARHFDTNHMIHLSKPKWRRRPWAAYLDLAFHIPFACHCHVTYSAVATSTYWLLFSVSVVGFREAVFVCVAIATTVAALTAIQLFSRQSAVTFQIVLSYLALIVG